MSEKEEDCTTRHENMKYSIGQKVIVVNDGEIYSTYFDWVSDNKLNLSANDEVRKLWSKYLDTEINDCKGGTKLIVVATGYHILNHIAMYLCKDSNGNPVLIGENGLDFLEKEDTKILNHRIAELEKENALVKALLYGTERTCDNCGFVNCENFQRQRKSEPCSLYIPYQVRIKNLAHESDVLRESYNNSEMNLSSVSEQLTKSKKIIKELSKSLFLAKGIIRDLIDDTVDFKESKERAIYCYEQEKFDAYKEAERFLKEK